MLAQRLIDGLYVETMLLADDARGYFDQVGRIERDSLDPLERVVFSCESLKVTTRLMHVIAWLLSQRAVAAGEAQMGFSRSALSRLGGEVTTDPSVLSRMPAEARVLIETSIELFKRVERLDQQFDPVDPVASPARSLLNRLEQSF